MNIKVISICLFFCIIILPFTFQSLIESIQSSKAINFFIKTTPPFHILFPSKLQIHKNALQQLLPSSPNPHPSAYARTRRPNPRSRSTGSSGNQVDRRDPSPLEQDIDFELEERDPEPKEHITHSAALPGPSGFGEDIKSKKPKSKKPKSKKPKPTHAAPEEP